jgi:Putative DNA-binding domain
MVPTTKTKRRGGKKNIYTSNKISSLLDQTKDCEIGDLIRGGESLVLEFKSSMLAIMKEDLGIKRLQDIAKDVGKYEKRILENSIRIKEIIIRDKLETSIIKTIASFLNSEGGVLLIGVEDDGKICGIEKDYYILKEIPKNWEGWLDHLLRIIEKQIGLEFVDYIQIERIFCQDKTIAKIIVKKSSIPVYIVRKNIRFYVRRLNTCRSLDLEQSANYIVNHWPLR